MISGGTRWARHGSGRRCSPHAALTATRHRNIDVERLDIGPVQTVPVDSRDRVRRGLRTDR